MDLDHAAVDPRGVAALQVREDELAGIALDPGVVAADGPVVKAQDVAFVLTDGHRRQQAAEDTAFIDSFQDPRGYARHETDPCRRAPAQSARANRTALPVSARAGFLGPR